MTVYTQVYRTVVHGGMVGVTKQDEMAPSTSMNRARSLHTVSHSLGLRELATREPNQGQSSTEKE